MLTCFRPTKGRISFFFLFLFFVFVFFPLEINVESFLDLMTLICKMFINRFSKRQFAVLFVALNNPTDDLI